MDRYHQVGIRSPNYLLLLFYLRELLHRTSLAIVLVDINGVDPTGSASTALGEHHLRGYSLRAVQQLWDVWMKCVPVSTRSDRNKS